MSQPLKPLTEIDCTHLVSGLDTQQEEWLNDWREEFRQLIQGMAGKKWEEVQPLVIKHLQKAMPQ